jgi:hypothetical protein
LNKGLREFRLKRKGINIDALSFLDLQAIPKHLSTLRWLMPKDDRLMLGMRKQA